MPWAEVDKAAAPATTTALSATWIPFPGDISVTAGQQLFFVMAARNSNINTPTFTLSKPLGETATWQRTNLSRSSATSNSGVRFDIFEIIPETDWSNYSVEVTTNTVVAGGPSGWADWLIMEGGSSVPRTLDWMPFVSNGAGASTASHALTGLGQPREGDLCIGFSANGALAGPTPALDSDTTNGVWVDAGSATTGSASPIAGRLQYKVVTARGDQTLDPTDAQFTVQACLLPAESFHVVQEGGTIDATTANPAWQFQPQLIPVEPLDLLVGGTMHKAYTAALVTPATYDFDILKASGTVPIGGGSSGSQVSSIYHKIADGSEGADIVVAEVAAPLIGTGEMVRLKAGVLLDGDLWDTEVTAGADTTVAGTDIAVTCDTTIDIRPRDVVIFFAAGKNSGTFTSPVLIIPGVTGVQYNLPTAGFITDPDGSLTVGYVECDTGEATGAIQFTATYTSGQADCALTVIRVRRLLPPVPPVGLTLNTQESHSLELCWVE